jgi:predicted Zn-dependent protease
MEKTPGDLALILSMADLRTRQGRFDDVEKIYGDLLAKEPKNVFALNNLAVLLALRGKDIPRATEMIDQAISLAGPDAVFLDSRATVLMAAGKFDAALADLDEAVNEDASPLRLFHQTQAQFEKGDKAAARKLWKETIDAGQTREQLHPLERPVFDKLRQSLAQ